MDRLPDNKSDYYGNDKDLRTFDDDFSDDPIYWSCDYCSEPVHQDSLFEHITNCPKVCDCDECQHDDLNTENCEINACKCCFMPKIVEEALESVRLEREQKAKPEIIDLEEIEERIERAFTEDIFNWDLQTLTNEVREEILGVVLTFVRGEEAK